MRPDLNLAAEVSRCSFRARPVQLMSCEFSLTGGDCFKTLPLKLRCYLYLLEICLVFEALWYGRISYTVRNSAKETVQSTISSSSFTADKTKA